MNQEAMSVDLGPIAKPRMTVSYDEDKGVVCRIAFEVNIAPGDISRILDAGKTTTLRAKIFTQAPPMLPESDGRQLGLGSAMPPAEHGIEVGKDSATDALEAAVAEQDQGPGPAAPADPPF